MAAVCLVLMAATARGPLGVARVCPARAHAILDGVVPVALALAPIVPWLRPDPIGIVVLEATTLAWLRVATLTRYRSTPAGGPDPHGPAPVAADADAGPGGAPAVARSLGVFAGRAARRLPAVEQTVRRGARQARAHLPAAEAALRRAARQAGEHAARHAPPDDGPPPPS